jgi:hypothetical protein
MNETESDLIGNQTRSFIHKRDHPGHSSMGDMGRGPQLAFFQRGGEFKSHRENSVANFMKDLPQGSIELGTFSDANSRNPDPRFYGKVVPSEILSNVSLSAR